MPAGNDPTPLAELEQSFGVTSSAEELIKANQARMTDEQRAGTLKPTNGPLTDHVRENQADLEKFLGLDVIEPTVRGSGTGALIHYAYVGARDAYEKGYVPFAEVFGSSLLKKSRRTSEAARQDPDEEARRAADEVLAEARAEADRIRADAQAKAQEAIDKAREEADEAIREANEKIAEQQESVSEEAQDAADDARERAERERDQARAEQAKRAAKKPAAKRSAS